LKTLTIKKLIENVESQEFNWKPWYINTKLPYLILLHTFNGEWGGVESTYKCKQWSQAILNEIWLPNDNNNVITGNRSCILPVLEKYKPSAVIVSLFKRPTWQVAIITSCSNVQYVHLNMTCIETNFWK